MKINSNIITILNYSGGKQGIKPPDFLCIWGLHSALVCAVLDALTAGAFAAVGVAVELVADWTPLVSAGAATTVLAGLGASTPAAT